jgi:hypothetical protein
MKKSCQIRSQNNGIRESNESQECSQSQKLLPSPESIPESKKSHQIHYGIPRRKGLGVAHPLLLFVLLGFIGVTGQGGGLSALIISVMPIN